MQLNEALIYSFEQIRELVHSTVRGLDAEQLAWRPDPGANSVAWLVWHLTRVQDDHVAEIVDQEQRWMAGAWAERFGLPGDFSDTGFGHSPEQVAAIRPRDPQVLVAYHDDVARVTTGYLRDITSGDFDRIIDRSCDPAVTVGVRLMSVHSDALQHVGQAAYARGLLERGS